MKYSVLITADRHNLSLLALITGDLSCRRIFPEHFSCETAAPSTVRIRLELECEEKMLLDLREYWEFHLRVQAVVTTPALPENGPDPVEHGAPATTAMD